MAVDEEPLHNVWLLTAPTVGVGFTVIVKVCVAPVQVLADGVTTITATDGVVPLFTAVNDAMSPAPVAASPIDVFVLVQV